jgi:hypothetical protein
VDFGELRLKTRARCAGNRTCSIGRQRAFGIFLIPAKIGVVGQFQHVGQDAILQRVVNPRSLRRLAIGAQVTNLPTPETDPLLKLLPDA